VSPTLTTFLFELANFLLLAVFLGWLLFKPVRDALEARQLAEQQRATELDAREQQIATGRSALDASRVAFEQETARMRKERLAAAEAEATTVIARAREATDRERDRAGRIRVQLEHDQIERLAMSVATTTRQAVARLLTTLGTGDLDQALVQAACRQLDAAATGTPGPVLVESAALLDDAARATISRAAGAGATPPEFRVVPALGAGVRITTPRGLIDASAAGIAAHAERALVSALSAADSTSTGADPGSKGTV
jgi:F0F1-type ATP synthase membrane subunit b/b'